MNGGFIFFQQFSFFNRAFQSADQDDLFTAMNDQAVMDEVLLPVPVKTIMDTWTFQMGYPLVTVTRNYEDGLATITQVSQTMIKKKQKLYNSNVELMSWRKSERDAYPKFL